jgi:SOS-response transcriptional repressor LexA
MEAQMYTAQACHAGFMASMNPAQEAIARRIGRRIRQAREQKGWTALQLGEHADLSQSFLSKVESGKTGLSDNARMRIAGALAIAPEHLFSMGGNVTAAAMRQVTIPLLDYVQAGRWMAVRETLSDDEIRETITVNFECPPSSFGLKVRGDSMEPEFHEGDTVIVDPTRQPSPGRFVIATDEGGEATFKQYRDAGINDDGRHVFALVPLNDHYATMRSDRQKLAIVGVVIGMVRQLLK